MTQYEFSWLNDVNTEQSAAIARVVSIFLRGITPEDLEALQSEDDTEDEA